MALSDRREPGVYVDIEDHSYMADNIETGRTIYSVILCDRGPNDRITRITSQRQFHELFGKPNFLRTSQTHYMVDRALQYTGSALVTRIVPEDAYWGNVYIKAGDHTGEDTSLMGVFTQNVNTVNVLTKTAIPSDVLKIGSWIFTETTSSIDAMQIINIDEEYEPGTTTITSVILTLDRAYTGNTTVDITTGEPIKVNAPFTVESLSLLKDEKSFVAENNPVYYFYSFGSGTYYNRLRIRGTRNTDLEKYYIDDNGNPLYKYVFMDLGVYEEQDNGQYRLLEGPWTVSLIPRLPGSADYQKIKDPTSGADLYIEEVINTSSNFIRCAAGVKNDDTGVLTDFPSITSLINDNPGVSNAEDLRLQLLLMFATFTPVGTLNVPVSNTGLALLNGTDGEQYDVGGNLSPSDELLGRVAQAFGGTLTDNGIDQLREELYPIYQPDYVICGGFPSYVQKEAMSLCEARGDCFCLADTGYKKSYDKDITARQKEVPWNSFNAMLYTQYRYMFDIYTGRSFWFSPVYHATEKHLFCDAMYFLAEPVAGISKTSIADAMRLAYVANHTERGDMGDVELNVTISEPDGTYFLTQFTTWKQYSVLKRAHVAKFVCYLKKSLRPILKEILQHRATTFWINQAKIRVNTFLNKFLESATERYSVLKSFDVQVEFDDVSSSIDVYIDIYPIRAIEKINVVIAVN